MEYGRIELLLEKYWVCETTPEEEDELRCFFNETEELPAHLLRYKELFVYQQQEQNCMLDDSFDKRILAKIAPEKNRWIQNRSWITGIAASFLLALSIWFLAEQPETPKGGLLADTYETPEQAYAEVQRMLSFVSVKMNQGEQVAKSSIGRMETITKYIE